MLDADTAARWAERCLAASPADETEVVVDALGQEVNRFTTEHPVQNLVREEVALAVRVRVDGREAKAVTGVLSDDGVQRVVERACDLARRAPRLDDDAPALPAGYDLAPRDDGPLAVDPVATAERVAAVTEPCRAADARAAGIHETSSRLRVVRNSAGLAVHDWTRHGEVSLSVFRDDGAGWANHIASDPGALDVDAVAARAVDKALRSRGAEGMSPGHATVVLEPSAVASLLLFTAGFGFGAQQVHEGNSFVSGRLGEPVLGDGVTIVDDVDDPRTLGHRFDGVGARRRRVVLIDGGVATGVVHDARTAARDGCASTGHARPQPDASGPLPSNLILECGTGSVDELIADVDDGVLVTEFHYTNVVEPTALTLTGMTRYGTFTIEKGEVARPLRNMRFTQSLVDAFRNITGIGGDATLCSALFGGHVVVPALRIDGFSFSSGTEF